MNRPLLKICGMRDPVNILAVAELHPDFMGFIFYKGSRRYVGDEFTIPDQFPKDVKKVGVFVNETTDKILNIVAENRLDLVQLHGDESIAQCTELRSKGLEIIKMFSVDEYFDFSTISSYEHVIDYCLFDTRTELRGGSGISFDWKLLDKYSLKTPFFLSGGLSASKLNAIKKVNNNNLYGLDVNSGVESSPGIKDLHKVTELKKLVSAFNE